MIKKFGGMALTLLLLLQLLTGCAPGMEPLGTRNDSDSSDAVLTEGDLSQYENCEALVAYADGDVEVLSFADDDALAQGLEALLTDPAVALIQPNYSYSNTALTSDLLSSRQWSLYNDGTFSMRDGANEFPVYDDPFGEPSNPGQWNNPDRPEAGYRGRSSSGMTDSVSARSGIDINISEAWDLYNGGSREVIIAIIDSGINNTHEDFGDVFWINEGEVAGNGMDDDGNGYIDDIHGWNFYHDNNAIYTGNEDNHGTHVAGTIAATVNNGTGIAGIAGNTGSVRIMSLKVLGGADGSGTTLSVLQAIQYAESNGASICNLSLGGTSYDSMLYRAMATSNMLFVVAAGNESANLNTSAHYPASFDLDNMITVANLQPDGTLHPTSNYGTKSVNIAAPGTYILSLTTGDSYSYMTGTSMAAPAVTAIAAMLYSHSNTITLAEVKQTLLQTAEPLNTLSGMVTSNGMVDAGAALRYADQNYPVSDLPFYDVKTTDSSYEAISYLYGAGIMLGTDTTSFSPDTTLTRAMTVTILGRLAGVSPQDNNLFVDVLNETWYSGYVGWAVERGIVVGYGNGIFGTEDPVQAYQLDLMLARLAAQSGRNYNSGLTGSTPLTRSETAQALYAYYLWMMSDA